jgi:hypothetical protein
MAYVTPEYVKQMQLKHKTPYWKICDKTKKTVINRNQTDNLSYSIDELQDALNISGDYVLVTLYTNEPTETKPGDKRGQSFDLMVKLLDNYQNNNNNKGMNGAPVDMLLRMNDEKHALNLEIERLKNAREAEPKKHWIAEIASNNPELLSSAINIGKQAASKIFDMMTPKNNPGINGVNGVELTPQIKEILKKFENIDPNYVDVLKRMANFVSADPSMYFDFKKKLGFEV